MNSIIPGSQRKLDYKKSNSGFKAVKLASIAAASGLCFAFQFWNVLSTLSGNLTIDETKLLLSQLVPSKIGKQFHSTLTRGQCLATHLSAQSNISILMSFTLLPQFALAIHGGCLAAVETGVSNSVMKYSRTGKLVLMLTYGFGSLKQYILDINITGSS